MDIKGQIEKDAHDFAEEFTPRVNRSQKAIDYQIAFVAGARQLRIYADEFIDRVDKLIGEPKGEFEQGQRDGLFWFRDYLTDLFGESGEE